jgi:co-chaperonin GroES (HSP10)
VGAATCAGYHSNAETVTDHHHYSIRSTGHCHNPTGKLAPLDVKAGDRVLFGKWSGTEVKIDGQDLLIMKESDILGIVG